MQSLQFLGTPRFMKQLAHISGPLERDLPLLPGKEIATIVNYATRGHKEQSHRKSNQSVDYYRTLPATSTVPSASPNTESRELSNSSSSSYALQPSDLTTKSGVLFSQRVMPFAGNDEDFLCDPIFGPSGSACDGLDWGLAGDLA
jgi:hypothetical protein